jgi:hypothetical protein
MGHHKAQNGHNEIEFFQKSSPFKATEKICSENQNLETISPSSQKQDFKIYCH